MPASEAQKRANQKWQLKVYKYKTFKLHKENDKDILEWLTILNKEGKATNSYIKKLIREDMKKHQEQ